MTDLALALNSLATEISPRLAIILGSGLGGLADMVEGARRVPYGKIPGFPETRVKGHSGELVLGELEGTPVILQNGRFHLYEGHDPSVVAMPVRLFADLGVGVLIVTNAAGGLNPMFRPPALMLIADHVNLMWRNPLFCNKISGKVLGPDLSEAYDRELRTIACAVALEAGIHLTEGVYAGVLGPSFETPAEVRMLRKLGCDAVGMSTVPEVIAAKARGIKVLGISSITNAAAGLSKAPLSHEQVLEAGKQIAGHLQVLVRGAVKRLGEG